MKHDEYHRQFADAIIEQIRQGTAPGRSPGGRASACSPRTSIPTAPIAAATACTSPPSSRSAATATCAGAPTARSRARDGQVRKGEQGTRILSFQDHRKIAVNDERGRPKRDNEGKRVYRHERLKAPVVRQYTVFNAEQADGLPARPTPTAEPLWKVHQQAEQRPRGRRGPRPSRGGRPRVLQPEPRRDRAARARTVPLREPLLPDRAARAGAQHRPPGAHEPRDAHPRDL